MSASKSLNLGSSPSNLSSDSTEEYGSSSSPEGPLQQQLRAVSPGERDVGGGFSLSSGMSLATGTPSSRKSRSYVDCSDKVPSAERLASSAEVLVGKVMLDIARAKALVSKFEDAAMFAQQVTCCVRDFFFWIPILVNSSHEFAINHKRVWRF